MNMQIKFALKDRCRLLHYTTDDLLCVFNFCLHHQTTAT